MSQADPEPLILIVEDSEDDAFFLERALRRSDLRCRREYVKDGGQAVAYLQRARQSGTPEIAAVLLDLKMPVMNGFDVLRWVRQQGYSDVWDIIILSGSDQISDVQAARELGAGGYLVKPARTDELCACLLPRLHQWKARQVPQTTLGPEALRL